jgi:hypothetical protein
MATLTYAPRGSSSYEQTRKAIFDASIASGAVRVIEGYPVPILVVDRIASRVEQYYADQLLIDGRRLREDVAFVEIAAHISRFPACRCGYSAGRSQCRASVCSLHQRGRSRPLSFFDCALHGAV